MRGICWLPVVLWVVAPIADAKEKVLWVVNEGFLPGHIAKGPMAGTGFLDLHLRWLIARLGMFDNEIAEASNSRGFHELSMHDGQCMVGVAETPERLAVAAFSRTSLLVPAAGVMIETDALARFASYRDASGDVELSRLEAAAGLHGAYARDRHFGTAIDSYIQSHDASLLSVQNSMQAMKMLSNGRIDYVFGYSFEQSYYRAAIDPAAEITFLPLANAPPVNTAHVACSRGPLGEAVIRQIDRLLEESPVPPPYMAEVSRWFDKAGARAAMDPDNWADKPKP